MEQLDNISDKQNVIVGYVLVGLSGILTLTHLGVIAIFIAIGTVVFLTGQTKRSEDKRYLSHFFWQKRTVYVLLLAMGLLFAWFGYEVMHMNKDNFMGILAAHWLAHTLTSVSIGGWAVYRVIRGLLRHTDGRPMYKTA